MDMGEMGKYHMFNRPHGMIGGMMNKPPEMANVPPNWQIYFLVPDILVRRRTDQGERRPDPQRPDGSARRRLGRERDGSAGRGIRAAREKGSVVGLQRPHRIEVERAPGGHVGREQRHCQVERADSGHRRGVGAAVVDRLLPTTLHSTSAAAMPAPRPAQVDSIVCRDTVQ